MCVDCALNWSGYLVCAHCWRRRFREWRKTTKLSKLHIKGSLYRFRDNNLSSPSSPSSLYLPRAGELLFMFYTYTKFDIILFFFLLCLRQMEPIESTILRSSGRSFWFAVNRPVRCGVWRWYIALRMTHTFLWKLFTGCDKLYSFALGWIWKLEISGHRIVSWKVFFSYRFQLLALIFRSCNCDLLWIMLHVMRLFASRQSNAFGLIPRIGHRDNRWLFDIEFLLWRHDDERRKRCKGDDDDQATLVNKQRFSFFFFGLES